MEVNPLGSRVDEQEVFCHSIDSVCEYSEYFLAVVQGPSMDYLLN